VGTHGRSVLGTKVCASITLHEVANGVSEGNAQSPKSAAPRQPLGTLGNQATGGEGRNLLERNCQQCHDLATASTKLRSEDWNAVIEKMASYGARLSATDKQKLVDYLEGLEK
jgi:cytochrome c5